MQSCDPVIDENNEKYIPVKICGNAVLRNPKLNKGSAFTYEERVALRLLARLPYKVETLEEQVKRRYAQFKDKKTDLEKNIYLNALHDSNEILFYKLLTCYLEEMLPIIYTPTIAIAIKSFSLEYRRPQGLFISYPDIDKIDEILDEKLNEEIDLVLVTDGEGLLGIGDWGVGGMQVCIGKLMVYTVCGSLNPNRVLPIQLDVGTNNKELLENQFYLGWRHERISGKKYDEFVDRFVKALQAKSPNIYLHWEDFGRENARRNLFRYRNEMATFNDDMQGTGATAVACVLSAMVAKKENLIDQIIVLFGAGTAGCGIADQMTSAMMSEGLSKQEAEQRIYLVDRNGLLYQGMENLESFHQPYLREQKELEKWDVANKHFISLLEVVRNTKPTILIGCSTCHDAFTEEIVKAMLAHCDYPVVLPLSNPTFNSEAEPKDLIAWSDGKIFIAVGSPFDPVIYKGKTYFISQSNNAFVFPGIGRGVIASKAKYVSDEMITAACHALSLASPARHDPSAPLLPNLCDVSKISDQIALAVALKAREQGLSQVSEEEDLQKVLEEQKWEPHYYPYRYVR